MIEDLFLCMISGTNKLTKYRGEVYFGALLEPEKVAQMIRPGGTFLSRNFTSTSTVESVAESFANRGEGMRPGSKLASYLFTIKNSHSGVSLDTLAVARGESEIIFQPNHSFKVLSVKRLPDEHGVQLFNVELAD